MKKLLPRLKNSLKSGIRSISMALVFLTLLFIANVSKAQIYYVTNDAAPTSAASGDAIVRMGYDGSGATVLASSITNSPNLLQIDYANNRAFVYEGYQLDPVPNPNNLAIKVINLTNGTVIRSIPLAVVGRATSLKYDPVNDYIYYVTGDPLAADAVNATANDALIRVKPDGTGSTILASGFCKNPAFLALNVANNEIYVYQNLYADPRFYVFNLSGGSLRNFATTKPAAPYIGVDMAYDNINNYLYYLTSDNSDGVNAKDALKRINIDGTGETTIASSIGGGVIYAMTVDPGHNKAYFFDKAAGANRGINSVDLTTGSVSLVKSIASPTLIPGFAVPSLPVITTTAVSTYSGTSATMGGNITRSDVTVTERGVVYSSTNATPTIGASGVTKATNGTGTGSFSASVAGLSAATTYYVRAYATSAAGTAYGTVSSFATQSNDANLSALSISSGTLNPAFSAATTSYTASVGNATTSITVTPTRNQGNATIKVNGTTVNSGSASGAINLNVGDNATTTVVTAQDGTTTKTYTVTVNRAKAAQTITFASINTKTYGDADYAPGATASSGLGVSYSSDNTLVATIVSGQIHIVGQGTANITASQAGDGNTLAATNIVQALTVNKMAVTVTANAGQTKVYGNADPTLAYAVTSGTVKSGDTFSGALTRAAGENVGSYAITQGTLALSNNYTLSFVSNDLAITKRPLEITPTPQTKVYGNAEPASYTYNFTSGTSLASGDGMTGVFTRPTGESVGVYPLSLGTKRPVSISNGADQSGNYNLTFVSSNITITKRPLTIAPLPVTKVYGDVDFATGAPYSFNGTSIAAGEGMTGTFGRDNTSENIGVYALTLGSKRPVDATTGADRSSNYDISFITNTFTITAKPIAVNVYSQTKAYGDADPALTYVSSGLSFSDTFTGTLTRDAGESVGTYAINQGTLALSGNYAITYVGANLSIGAKTINVTANAANKTYGAADPAFTYVNDALSFGDVFTGSLTRDEGEDVGSHAITQGTLALNGNYTINYTSANLSIDKATLTYVATPASRPFRNPDPAFTGTVTGFVNGDNQASATGGTLSFTSATTLTSPMGSYPLTGSGLSAANYDFVQDASNATAFTITASNDAALASLTIDQGTLSPAFSSSEKSYAANVDNNVTSFNFSATLNSAYATIYFNGNPYTSGSSTNVSLHTGSNYFTIVTLAQDGVTTDTYSLTIFRAYSTNNQLTSLSLSGVTLSPTFDTNTLNYTAEVGNLVTSTNISAAAVDNAARVFVNGNNLTESGPFNYSLVVGENAISVISKAENGDDKIYTVTVTRVKSPDATLTSFGNESITLNTPIVNGTTTYSTTVANGIGVLNFKPTTTNAWATVAINGQPVDRFAGATVNLAFGNNAITFEVTSEDGANHLTYTLNVDRVLSSDASLAVLSFPFITSLNETFDAGIYEYTATVADSTYTGIPLTATSANENAIVKIDGTVVPRFNNYTLPVHGGPNTYHITVTSQDASDTKTYTLVLTRAGTPPPVQSPVANLLALNISSGTSFSKNFNLSFGAELTTVYAPNSVESIRVFPVSENTVSTVTVNGVTLPYDTTTDLLPVAVGDNLFTIVVTSEDGEHTKTYDLHVNRLPYADVTLASLTINKGTLSPAFVAGTRTYTVTVPNYVSTLDVTPVVNDGTATVQIGATTINASTPTATVDLFNVNIPANRIRVVVTAADGVNTQTYTINVTRLAPGPNLASLALNAGTLSPVFNPATGGYTATVTNEVTSISVKPTAQDAGATITVNGDPVESDAPSNPIALTLGENTISVVSTAQDGVTTKSYTVVVTRLKSSNGGLSTLKLTPSSTLASISGSSTLNYSTMVEPGVSSVTLTAITQETEATIMVNGAPAVSGTASAPILLGADPTIINVAVTAPDGVTVKTFSIRVTHRELSSNAIAVLKLTPASTLVSTPGTGNYTATVDPALSSITLTATAQNENATIAINGVTVPSGEASGPITLGVGATVINVVVTAQDGLTVKSYSVTVNRTGSNNAFLKFKLTPASILTTAASGSSDVNYTTSVAPGTSSITIIPTAQNQDVAILINGTPVVSGASSAPINLSVGTTSINIQATAQDGVTVKTFNIAVNRTGSSNAGVSVKLSPSLTLVATDGTSMLNYSALAEPGISSVTLTPTAQEDGGTIMVNGIAVTSGTASAPILLNTVGETAIQVLSTAQDGITTKTISIKVSHRVVSTNATAVLKLTPAATLVSAGGVGNYTTTVDPALSSVTLTATAQNADATITVNGVPVASGEASGPITLSSIATVINVVVTAQDGTTVKNYSVTVNKTGSNNAFLKFKLTPASTLTTTTGSSNVNYTTSVSSGTSSITIRPTAQNQDVAILINGNPVVSGATSAPILLNVGTTVINVQATAQDGVTVKTFSITVNRPPESFLVNRSGSKLLFANKAANSVAPTDDDGVVVHQGVSPNGDGSNDFLYIEGVDAYAGNKLSIMNTSGNLVFQANDYGKDGNNLFDGHSNKTGAQLKPGTYYYSLEYKVGNDNKRKTGYIILKY